MIKLKRVYDRPEITDGERILVDRLWPRGIRRSTLNVDYWLKDIGPSNELRKWFAHDPKKWMSFKAKYKKELEEGRALKKLFAYIKDKDPVTFLYASRDEKHNNARVLLEIVSRKLVEAERKERKARLVGKVITVL